MFILNQDRDRAIYIIEEDIKNISIRNKSIRIYLGFGINDEEWIGDFDTDDQARAELFRLIKCLTDGHKLFIVSNPKDLVNFENS